ncbi:heterokaryon incompatibility protein-domain-containing protein [Paraphoma chrysanthemicola]|uniref:Heterokaryon incompatibility protein-domain-containing protein n=1 Tax=Paraphoma chrysanthemicola TaxID=798071 RepID=A0A8K0VTB3_9PLEO|nr:heterokaryon incompatibility protein-domain-containing protein [Paraphoma chrysanthemicola]
MPQCVHPDVQKFDEIRCCLSCGEAVFERAEDDTEEAFGSLASTAYRYKRLNYELGQEIRLVNLYPAVGDQSSDITCSIVHVNLADEPAFEAVSYTWADSTGDASLCRTVLCHGKTIVVTKNCEAALRRFRQKGRNRLLWIDAICIDQNNTSERNHQVKLMASIYSSAVQVLAFLGPTSAEVDAATDGVMDYLQDGTSALGDEDGIQRENSAKLFLQQPYFDRLWVLQEIGLAKLAFLVTMNKSVRWDAENMQKVSQLCSDFNMPRPSLLHWAPSQRTKHTTLLDALHQSRNCSATDPRDKVFGVLGLTGMNGKSVSFPVDYSLTTAQVFEATAAYLLEQEGFDVLRHTSTGVWGLEIALREGTDSGSPIRIGTGAQHFGTWIPTWNVKENHSMGPLNFSSKQRRLNKRPSGNRSFPSPCLRTRAHRLDEIVEFDAYGFNDRETVRHAEGLPALRAIALCTECCTPANIRQISRRHRRRRPKAMSTIWTEHVQDDFSKGLFSTTQSMGFARDDFHVGDTIWMLGDASVPFILRPEGDHYLLLSECYLHRAGKNHVCAVCEKARIPWPITTEIIDIW